MIHKPTCHLAGNEVWCKISKCYTVPHGHHLNHLLGLLLMHPLCTWLSSDTSKGIKNRMQVCMCTYPALPDTRSAPPNCWSCILTDAHNIQRKEVSENEEIWYERGRVMLCRNLLNTVPTLGAFLILTLNSKEKLKELLFL